MGTRDGEGFPSELWYPTRLFNDLCTLVTPDPLFSSTNWSGTGTGRN